METRKFNFRQRLAHPVGEASRTQQSHRETCDINTIMARYQKGQLIEHVNKRQGRYDDFLDFPDFHTALTKIGEAHEMFLEVPAKLREMFDNDPGKFLAFVTNPENEDKMREIGLMPKKTPAPKEEQRDEKAPATKKEAGKAPQSSQGDQDASS